MRWSEARRLVEAWAHGAVRCYRAGGPRGAATHKWPALRAVALRLAADLVATPACHRVWVDDGERRHDAAMLAGGQCPARGPAPDAGAQPWT